MNKQIAAADTGKPGQRLVSQIPQSMAGLRLDQALVTLFPAYSRSRLSGWVKSGQVQVDGCCLSPASKVGGGERVELLVSAEPVECWEPQDIPLNIVYEDDAILVVDKPAGLVVHPAAGNRDGTLLNALLHHAPELARVPRAGIVHRLDKLTSGLLVVARDVTSHIRLVEQLQARTVTRRYCAVVVGVMPAGGVVEAPIGRHRTDRKRMTVTERGKEAISHYRVTERFAGHSLIEVRLETGRTHQIRVHMAHIRYPLVGDAVYGGRLRIPSGCGRELAERLRGFKRQALHAGRLGIFHPVTGEAMEWRAALPDDLAQLIDALRRDQAADAV